MGGGSWLLIVLVSLSALGCQGDDGRRPPPGRTGPLPSTKLAGRMAGPQAGEAAASGKGGGAGSTSVGQAGRSGSGGTAVAPPAGGAASSPGTAGAEPGGALTPEQCLEGLMAAGQNITDCERCMCQPDGCLDQIAVLEDDVPGAEMISCVLENNCDQECCLCGAKCGLTTYGDGPCAAQIERAAGVTPGRGLGNIAGVMEACVPGGPPTNSCAKATRLGVCIGEKCGSMCPLPPVCQ